MLNTNTSWKLIEQDRSVEINENEDPLLEKEYSSYIQISERPNPGRRSLFNGMSNVSTVNVRVTGLNMLFGPLTEGGGNNKIVSASEETDNETSPLEGLTGRPNVENLYLYADTIIIQRQLHFPQTNVYIYARRLIMSDRGEIRTTPNPLENFDKAGTEGNVANGKNAPAAGDVFLHVKEFSSSRNEESLLTEELTIPDYLFSTQKDFKTPNMHPSFRMFSNGSVLEFEFSDATYHTLNIMLVEECPKKLNTKLPDKFHGIMIDNHPDRGFSLHASAVGYEKSYPVYYPQKKEVSVKIKMIHESGKLIIMGASRRGAYKEIGVLKSDGLKNSHFVGFANTDSGIDHILSASLTIKRIPPLFSLNGAKGQNGQLGDLKPIPKADQTGDLAHPVTVEKLWERVFDFDFVKGSNKLMWFRPPMNYHNNYPILFVKATIYNVHGLGKKKVVELGNREAENPSNGADAFASGTGGNGGNSGTLHYSAACCDKAGIDTLPGALGISPVISGGRGMLNYPAFHMEYKFVHNDPDSRTLGGVKKGETDGYLIENVIKTIDSRHGKDGVGENGSMGQSGSIKKINKQNNAWIHPFMLERAVQFAKNEFMQGNRHTATWMVDSYRKELPEKPDALVNHDIQLADLMNEIRIMNNRLASRLDYFGKPIGWVPRLSTLTNIQLIKFIKRNTVQALFYADTLLSKDISEADVRKQLNFAINHLNEEIKNDRNILANAHKELPKIKDELNAIQRETDKVHTKIRALNDKVTNDVIKDEQEQALFTSALKICSGLCHLIPVGQPFVGQIAGGILDVVGNIDIHSDTPFKEALGVTDSLSSKLGDFINDNKGDLTKSLTADLDKSLTSNQSSIGETQKKADVFTQMLKEHKPTFESAFESKLFKKLKEELATAQQIDSFEKLEFYSSTDYAALMDNINYLKDEIKTMSKASNADKSIIIDDLGKVLASQKTLKKEKEKLEATRDSRTKTLEKAGKVTHAVGESLSKVSQGLQGMMVSVDKDDSKFKEAMTKALSGKYKEEFTLLNTELNELNDKKMPVINRMIKVQQIIDSHSGSIMKKMVQIATFSDQRAQMTAGVLTANTRLYLQKVMEDSRELLLEHVDNLVKSFQYRYLQRVDSQFYQIHQLVKDIRTFEDKGSTIPNRQTFENAYDFALQSQFNALARKLLADMQGFSAPTQDHFTLTIDHKTKNHNGVSLLSMLNRIGHVDFRLHTLRGGSSKGSDEYFNYRIANIEFQNISVKTAVNDLSFRFGISHSGESVIRNIRDKQYYYFTTVHAADSADNGISYTRNWDATFNRADINPAKGENGLTNSKHVVQDEEALTALLTRIDENAEIKYREHLPSATSMLSLQIHDNKIEEPFEIEELTLKITYELKNK
ncbi:hypothetical protein [Lacinutrix sp. Hel_I_90]|uniref:hypothetical protein n=1 Tax=Lacinutrix sp. Hel_I_90 TaxID=1249999 RepID=UPI0005CAB0F8|nr:hypothetical protein [Lacinutrix sp. Hel_I_90]